MNPRLSRGEYWLLSTVVELAYPLPVLGLPDETDDPRSVTIGHALNRQGHRLSMTALTRTLDRLHRRGWIRFRLFDHTVLDPTTVEIAAAVQKRGLYWEGMYYELTHEGGAIWEAFTRPLWHRYIDDIDVDEEGDAEDAAGEKAIVVCGSRRAMNDYRDAIGLEKLIVAGSETVDEIAPWNATYWKTLPVGIRWSFRYRPLAFQRGAYASNGVRRRWIAEWT